MTRAEKNAVCLVADPNWLKNRLYLANVTMPSQSQPDHCKQRVDCAPPKHKPNKLVRIEVRHHQAPRGERTDKSWRAGSKIAVALTSKKRRLGKLRRQSAYHSASLRASKSYFRQIISRAFIPGNYVRDGLIDLLNKSEFDFERPTRQICSRFCGVHQKPENPAGLRQGALQAAQKVTLTTAEPLKTGVANWT